jgi:hypothetical protein
VSIAFHVTDESALEEGRWSVPGMPADVFSALSFGRQGPATGIRIVELDPPGCLILMGEQFNGTGDPLDWADKALSGELPTPEGWLSLIKKHRSADPDRKTELGFIELTADRLVAAGTSGLPVTIRCPQQPSVVLSPDLTGDRDLELISLPPLPGEIFFASRAMREANGGEQLSRFLAHAPRGALAEEAIQLCPLTEKTRALVVLVIHGVNDSPHLINAESTADSRRADLERHFRMVGKEHPNAVVTARIIQDQFGLSGPESLKAFQHLVSIGLLVEVRTDRASWYTVLPLSGENTPDGSA